MGKKARDTRKAAAAANEAERDAAQLAHEHRARRNRILLMALPLVTAALAASVYFAFEDRRAVAAIVVVGLAFWVPVLLGTIGGSVPPRDRSRSGSIDFGRRD